MTPDATRRPGESPRVLYRDAVHPGPSPQHQPREIAQSAPQRGHRARSITQRQPRGIVRERIWSADSGGGRGVRGDDSDPRAAMPTGDRGSRVTAQLYQLAWVKSKSGTAAKSETLFSK